jgi:hypothetical protein
LGEKAVFEWFFHTEFGFGQIRYIHREFDIVGEKDLHFISGRRNTRRQPLVTYTNVRAAIAEMLAS